MVGAVGAVDGLLGFVLFCGLGLGLGCHVVSAFVLLCLFALGIGYHIPYVFFFYLYYGSVRHNVMRNHAISLLRINMSERGKKCKTKANHGYGLPIKEVLGVCDIHHKHVTATTLDCR